MKKLLFSLAVMLLLCPAQNFAQEQKEEIFYKSDVMPQFPGNENGIRKFIATNTKYPELARENNIEGKVFIRFVVSKTGKVINTSIIRSIDPIIDAEALRVVNLLPDWKPGLINNKPVNVWYTIPVNFSLSKNNTEQLDEEVVEHDMEIFFIVEEMPQFPGGEDSLKMFIAKNTNYPKEAANINIQGKIYIRFVVTSTGEIDKVSVIRGVDPILDKEAIRVVKLLPKWIPGKQRGKAVNVWYTVPIEFK